MPTDYSKQFGVVKPAIPGEAPPKPRKTPVAKPKRPSAPTGQSIDLAALARAALKS